MTLPRSVLILEDDPAIRQLLDVVIRREGFTTVCAGESSSIDREPFDVIVRDHDPIASSQSESGVPRLSSGELERTILTTTEPERLVEDLRKRVFAVVRKPFDIAALAVVVVACADSGRRNREIHDQETEELQATACSMQRFARNEPAIRRVLTEAPISQEEFLLRSEMRRVLGELSGVWQEAARTARPGTTRAAAFRAASAVATDLRSAGPRVAARSRRGH